VKAKGLTMSLRQQVRNVLRSGRTITRNLGYRVGYARGFSPQDRGTFEAELDAYRPKLGLSTTLLRWTMTEWCNFNCAYCYQVHARRAPVAGGFTNHCFDNFPVERWMKQFEHHFAKERLSLVITGGEPMLDARNMNIFLGFLAQAPWVASVRVDTNASWTPNKYRDLDTSKMALNCSFHSSQIREDTYFENLKAIQAAGFKIGFINYVYNREQRGEFERIREKIEALGLLINASPEFSERKTLEDWEVKQIRGEIIEDDYRFRLAIESPVGKRCIYPALSYEMRQTGHLKVGCMRDFSGFFFDAQLPFFGHRAAVCPHSVCSCLDKYSFLEGFSRNDSTDPFKIYCGKLRKLSDTRRGMTSTAE
jgi:organic radical activating enzyme